MRNTTKKATVRLSDIAKETGYSLSTVSKALNGRADVSEETRQTINAVLKRYGYSRKATGTKSQRIIEILFQDLIMLGPLKYSVAPFAKPSCMI